MESTLSKQNDLKDGTGEVWNAGGARGGWRLCLLEDSIIFQNPSCESLEIEREKATKMTGGRGSVGGGATEKVAERKKVTERERLALNQEERCSSTMGTAAVQVRNDGSASGEWRLWLLEDSVFFQNPSCESLESPVESRRRWRRVLTASVR
ncbi:hypothetical protein VNO78_32924 [Psophocarpus tetragonolobus]|uniref:Uncharacterized protein n=1 Tax=Psophocarpus tetragonolobus TaxID=3891 RepID=A0AAN9NW45_PSOTE